MKTKKRRRGGQPGNRNACKHGFYASGLTPAQLCEFWNIINAHGLDPELAALLVKLRSTLQSDPSNARVLREGSKLLAAWFSSKFHLDKKRSLALKKNIRASLDVNASLHEIASNLVSSPSVSSLPLL